MELDQQNAFDFRVAQYNGSSHLSFIIEKSRDGSATGGDKGVIMDNSYQVVKTVRANDGKDNINMHEFHVLAGENRALVITMRSQPANESNLNVGLDQIVKNYGFQEVDIDTGKTLFKWSCLDHVPVSDSYITRAHGELDFLFVFPPFFVGRRGYVGC
jgi:hypothetical protein